MEIQLIFIVIVMVNSVVTLFSSLASFAGALALILYASRADLFLRKLMDVCNQNQNLIDYIQRTR